MKPSLIAILVSVLMAVSIPGEGAGTADSPEREHSTIEGRFVIDGAAPPPPVRSRYDTINLNTPVSRDQLGRVSGVEIAYRAYLRLGIRPRTHDDSLLVNSDGGVANVLIFVANSDVPSPAANRQESEPTVLQIKDGQFTPRVVAVAANDPFHIRNVDSIGFGFHLQMFRNNSFNFIVPPQSEKSLMYSKPERTPLPFRSDHQAWASGFLFVHGNPYFAVSAPDGTFAISDIPPGTWEFRVWHEKAGYLKKWPKGTFNFPIAPGKNNMGDLILSPDLFNK